jgi:hypothetical protein
MNKKLGAPHILAFEDVVGRGPEHSIYELLDSCPIDTIFLLEKELYSKNIAISIHTGTIIHNEMKKDLENETKTI